MEKIKTTINKIGDLITMLLVIKERLEELGETDPSKGSIFKTLLVVQQFNERLDTILSNKKPRVSEELEMEVYKK